MAKDQGFEDSPEFRCLLAGDSQVDLTKIGLEIAMDAYPDLNPEAWLEQISNLADRVRDRCAPQAKPRQILGQINWVLFVEEQFKGNSDDYYDPRNSYLNDVLERKLGLPLSLSMLYLAVAQRVGEVTGEEIELDEEQLSPCSPILMVARMLRNLKAVYLNEGDFNASLPVMRRLVALTGGEPLERRDLGVACLHSQRAGEAIDHLQAYLQAAPTAEDARDIATLLRAAKRDVAAWN